jgi:Hg(II)-responsive transcriptional regulator
MPMTIGQVASRADVNVQTIRYYERRGLIPEPERTSSGYRRYTDDMVRRVGFIKRAQELGFSLNEISDLLKLRVRSATACAAVARRARSKIAVVEEKIADLRRMKRVLGRLVAACETRQNTGDCPILEAMESPGGGP